MTATKRKAKTSPKHRVDWPAVERDFRTGKLTQVELAEKHGIAAETLSRKVKKDRALDPSRWQPDLTEAVRQATNAALMTELVNAEVKEGQEQVNSTVKAAAELNKSIILGHRKDAQEARKALEQAMAAVLKCGAAVTDIREAATFASAVESLSRTAKNAVEIERKAFNLDEAPADAGDGLAELLQAIAHGNNAALQPVHQDPEMA